MYVCIYICTHTYIYKSNNIFLTTIFFNPFFFFFKENGDGVLGKGSRTYRSTFLSGEPGDETE